MAKKDTSLIPMRDLEKISGVSRATINFYIREGLLPPPEKSAKNMAYYDASFVKRLKFIKQMKNYNFSLKQIKHSLNNLCFDPDGELRTRLQGMLYNSATEEAERQPVTLEEIQAATGLDEDILRQMVELKIFYLVNAEGRQYDGSAVWIGKMLREQLEMGIVPETALAVLKKLTELSMLELRAFGQQVRQPLLAQGASFEQQVEAFRRFLESSSAMISFLHLHMLRMPLEKMNIVDSILDDID